MELDTGRDEGGGAADGRPLTTVTTMVEKPWGGPLRVSSPCSPARPSRWLEATGAPGMEPTGPWGASAGPA